ncbi:DRC10 protein, partial [Turnix velox]|nr:DRC10 protein [Turnix velox]
LKCESIETERIMTVLEETIVKLELSSLMPLIVNSLDRFADVLGPEITNSLIKHQKLSNEMQNLLSNSAEKDIIRTEEQHCCLFLLEQQLKSSVRDVLRLFLANSSLCQTLRNEVWTRESPVEKFIKAFAELRGFVLERLLTSPVEEKEKILFVESISLQIKKNTEKITTLQAELAAATQTQEEEIHKRDNTIRDLKTSMQELSKDYKTRIQNIKEEGGKLQGEEMQTSQDKCAKLQQDIKELEAQLDSLMLEHRASELTLRKRKNRMETEIMNWVQKYDAHMEENQAEYKEVQALYTKEKNELSLLMEKRDLLFQEYSQIEEERRKQEEKKEQELKELNSKTLAATCIQAFWRGYLIRSIYRSKLKKKKGKGKGKGKKTKK